MSIQENLLKLKNQIPVNVKLIAVSKTKPVQHIIELYDAGHRIFGENRVQELTEKFPQLPADIEWHFIGHLQTNKVKYIAPFVSLIHSVDSLKLLKEIDKEAAKNNRIVNCLLEMYIAGEESKFGLDISEAFTILDSPDIKVMHNIRICGVMGMATFTENMELVRKEFKDLKSYFELIKEKYFYDKLYFKEMSMGMSGDYPIAIEEGSTMVRIGTAIFGERYT
ncbi:MAG: YggS family pyridoxal phosphate-dependent enzyme [Bacteroidales bacterium]